MVPGGAPAPASLFSSLGKGVLQNRETPPVTLAAPLQSRTPGFTREEPVGDPWAETQGPQTPKGV